MIARAESRRRPRLLVSVSALQASPGSKAADCSLACWEGRRGLVSMQCGGSMVLRNQFESLERLLLLQCVRRHWRQNI